MARIRAIKIGFFKNEDLGSLTPWHRLLYEGLWLLADREGRLEDRPMRIKAELFPYDAAFPYVTDDGTVSMLTPEALLAGLASHGQPRFITRYEVDGRQYIQIDPVAWRKHQRPKADEMESLIPPPLGIGVDSPLSREEPRGTSRDRDDPREEREGERERERDWEEGKSGSSAPQAAPEPALLTYPIVGTNGHSWALTQSRVDEWARAFPGLDVIAEARKALSWVNTHPTRRKTAVGMPKFLNGWFNKAVNDRSAVWLPSSAPRGSPVGSGRTGPAPTGKYDKGTIRAAV